MLKTTHLLEHMNSINLKAWQDETAQAKIIGEVALVQQYTSQQGLKRVKSIHKHSRG